MKTKGIVTAVLLLFVGASLAAMVVKEMRGEPAPVEASNPAEVETAVLAGGGGTEAQAESQLVAYYFHGNARCYTCITIEKQAAKAITETFSAELEEGTLEWRVVNISKPENKHFINDFQLVSQSVVLVEERGDEVVRWNNLQRVWELVRNPVEFEEYIFESTVDFMAGSAS